MNNFGLPYINGEPAPLKINPKTGRVLSQYAHQVDLVNAISNEILKQVAVGAVFNIGGGYLSVALKGRRNRCRSRGRRQQSPNVHFRLAAIACREIRGG